jgi:hypothetical protein
MEFIDGCEYHFVKVCTWLSSSLLSFTENIVSIDKMRKIQRVPVRDCSSSSDSIFTEIPTSKSSEGKEGYTKKYVSGFFLPFLVF